MKLWIALAFLAVPFAAQQSPQCCRRASGSGAMNHEGMKPDATAMPARMGPGMMMNRMFAPLPDAIESPANPLSPAKVSLGRTLYFETRLSKDGKISCNSCHDLNTYGVDRRPTSPGFNNQHGTRNSPTVFNAAGHVAQFWDGRAGTVEEQAKGPILNPIEMALPSEKAAVAAIRSDPSYEAAFRSAFPGDANPITFDNIANAIGAFERTLVTPAKWDQFLKGDSTALTAAERQGLHTFMMTGCGQCHNGTYVGGATFQKLGQQKPYPNQKDLGRYEVTKAADDKMFFKVPSLRNVEKTGPYFHNGEVATLEDAVSRMAEFQLGTRLAPSEIQSIVTWLKTLTSENPAGVPRVKLP
ncbi:MAG: cytochrome c peroxidase [Bryobacteraceae bacterium]